MPMHGKKKTKKMAKGGAAKKMMYGGMSKKTKKMSKGGTTKMRYGGMKTKKMSRGGATRRR